MLSKTNMEAKEKDGRESTSNLELSISFVIFKRGLLAPLFWGETPNIWKKKTKKNQIVVDSFRLYSGCSLMMKLLSLIIARNQFPS